MVTAKISDKFSVCALPMASRRRPTKSAGDGLAWTEVGGELLTVEAAKLPRQRQSGHHGKLGEVMQESIRPPFQWCAAHEQSRWAFQKILRKNDLHISTTRRRHAKGWTQRWHCHHHRAGIGLSGNPVRCDVAMTGEITYAAKYLPIGGLKENSSPRRGGIKKV